LERVSLNSIIYSLFEIHDKEDISDCVTPRTKAFDGVTGAAAGGGGGGYNTSYNGQTIERLARRQRQQWWTWLLASDSEPVTPFLFLPTSNIISICVSELTVS